MTLTKPKVVRVKTNELRKGARIQLRNGWFATIADNARGNTRIATVEGYETETGSVYSHDIAYAIQQDGTRIAIEHTPAQVKLKKQVENFF
jgi:nitrogen fixation protein